MTYEDSGTVAVAAVEADIPDPVLTPGGLPDIASQTGALDTNAKLVWSMIRFTELDTPLREAEHEGERGYLWGGTLTAVLNDTWPILRNPGSATADVKLRLNQYLKLTHNMVCLNRGSRPGTRPKRLPLWWVRADWSDRLEDFRVVVTWTGEDQEATAPEPEASGAAFDSASVFDAAPIAESAGDSVRPAPEPEPEPVAPTDQPSKLLVCDYPGCSAGADGGPFTTERANVLPLHRRSHDVTDNIVDTVARLLAQGTDLGTMTIAEIAEAAEVHMTTINLRFKREELIERATARLAELRGLGAEGAQVQPVPVVARKRGTDRQAPLGEEDLREYRVQALRLVAFADANGTPLNTTTLEYALRGAFGGSNTTELLARLRESGELTTRTVSDKRGRDYQAVTADRGVLDGMDLGDGLGALEVAEGAPVDYAAVLARLLEDYAAKDRVIAGQDERLAGQAAVIEESRTELADLRATIQPLLDLAGRVRL